MAIKQVVNMIVKCKEKDKQKNSIVSKKVA